MKKSVLSITLGVFIISAVVIGCSSSEKKVENAQENVTEADEALRKANEAYQLDVENYRKEIADKIEANNQSITEFNIRIENEKKEAKADYKLKIAELEQKNTDMKKKMDDYKVEGKENWEVFKTEFNHDMDQLGKAFKDLTINNVK